MSPRPQRWRWLRARLAFLLGALAGLLSRVTGRGAGGTLPGKVVLWLAPDALTLLSYGRSCVLVSGTNGKSTTAKLLASAASWQSPVLTNADGANLLTGLVTTLMRDRRGRRPAVLEVDEAALPTALRMTGAHTVVLLNLSRDQLDRFSEVANHVPRWGEAIAAAPALRVVANADDPLVTAAVRAGRPDENGVVWVGAGAPWRGDSALCTRCDAAWDTGLHPWRCASCGLTEPATRWRLADGHLVDDHGTHVPLTLSLPGRATAANAVMALAAADLLAIPMDTALERMRAVQEVDGRYAALRVGDRTARLLLAKNPAGWLEVLDQLTQTTGDLLLGINARTADGVDPSWLWDVPFERLAGRTIVVFGECALDLSVRLYYEGIVHTVEPGFEAALAHSSGRDVVVAANYTAFVAARASLRTQGASAA